MNCISILTCQIVLSLSVVSAEKPVLSTEDTHETRTIEGWTVHVHRDLLKSSAKKTATAMRLMKVQLKRIEGAVPDKALSHLRKVPIWVNPQYPKIAPRAEYHPGARWLKDNNRDPIMEKAVEVTNVEIFEFEHRRMPYLMLHELAHAYHDRILGFSHPAIEATFERAKASGTYNSVRRYTGRKYTQEKAYAMSNAREYFAEGSEALFGRNDFFPFNRRELEQHDPDAFHLFKKLWESPGDMK